MFLDNIIVDNSFLLEGLLYSYSDCHQPIYKTNRLLLAYGVNLIVKLPQSIDPNLASRLRLMPGLIDDLPLTLVNGNELHVQSQTNDAYPVLLAILADRC